MLQLMNKESFLTFMKRSLRLVDDEIYHLGFMNDQIRCFRINDICIVYNYCTYNKIYLHQHTTLTVPHCHSTQIYLTSDADSVLQRGEKQQCDAAEHANNDII